MIIKDLPFKSYSDFLNELKPNGSITKMLKTFVFRGLARDFDLIPLSFRSNNLFASVDDSLSNTDHEIFYRCMEYDYLLKFYRHCNENGLKLPKTSFTSGDYSIPNSLDYGEKVAKTNWIPEELEYIAALAQHYGMPTRLLDWTFNIYTALYFASFNSVKEDFGSSEKLVIWAINYWGLERIRLKYPECAPPIRFVIPNYSDNPNIRAQKGILSYWQTGPLKDITDKVCIKPLNELLSEYNCNYYFGDNPVMYKITIPSFENTKILKHISSLGYNSSYFFPEYSGVKLSLEEEAMIKKAHSERKKTAFEKEKSSSLDLSEEEQECLQKFKNLSPIDRGRILECMDVMLNAYTPEQKENVS